MSRLALFLLGAPRIEFDGVPIEVDTRKATALLAYLAVTGERHSRDSLAALFWPDADQARAHAALRRTLSALNKALAGDWLDIDRETVGLDRGAGVWLDVDEFHKRLAERRTHGHPATETCPACLKPLTDAAALYRDDFLAGFTLRDSPGFDDWQFFQAESLRRELADALEKLVRGYGARGESEPAIAYTRRWLALDPLHEPAHRQLMQLYAWSGQRAAALRQYQECVRVLDAELGVAPLEETTQLYEAIKENRLQTADRRPQVAARGVSTAVGSRLYPLVGRTRELDRLNRAHAEAGRDGRLMAIEGEVGIGKTRLAEEFIAQARERGAVATSAHCFEGESRLAYSLFIEALRAALSQPDATNVLDRVPAVWRSETIRLLPELISRYPDVPPAPPLESPSAQGRFFEGVCQALLALCRGRAPGILFFDDLNWADEASLDLLTYLVRRLRGHAVLVIIAWRSEVVPPDHRLRHLVSEAQRAGIGIWISLRPFELPHVEELVEAVAAERAPLPAGLGEQLYRETEGVPFFVVEYLDAFARGAAGEWSMPAGVRDLLHARLSGMGETSRQLLQTAAVIGRSFDLDTLREASGRSEEETVSALEALIAQRLIREAAENDGEPAYDFRHVKMRELIYEEMGLARRRLLHRRVAHALIARTRRQGRVGPLAGPIGQHLQLAGQPAEAAEYFWLAGEQARALYANVEALGHYRAALACGYPDRGRVHEALGDLQTLRGEYADALRSFELAAAAYPSDQPSLARIEHKLGRLRHRQGERDLAEARFQSALNLLQATGDLGEQARVLTDWSLTAHHQGDTARATELAQRALALAESTGDPRARAQAHNMLGILARHRDDASEAARHLGQSLSLAENLGDTSARIAALNNLALVHGAEGKVDRAVAWFEQALALCVSIGDRHREAALLNNLADVLHAAGRSEEAMPHLKQAVSIFAEIGVEAGTWQPEIWKLTEW